MPTVLRELMRHETIQTTMQYYVGINAEATADELWNALGSTLGSTRQDERVDEDDESENSLQKQ